MPVQPITLIIADAHAIIRNGLTKTLEATKEIEVTAITHNSEQLISLCNQHQPDVMMIGAGMPGICNVKASRHIAGEFPHIPIIMIAGNNEAATITTMKTAGEFARLYKNASEDEIIKTIQEVHEGTYRNELYNGYYVNAVKTSPLQQLTPKEREILPLFCLDLTAKEIAAKKNLSMRTVEKHKEKIMQKLQVKGIGGMMMYAVRNNICITALLYWIILLLPADLNDIISINAAI
jgi:DNA-binding NarL/FixJ family response regulator